MSLAQQSNNQQLIVEVAVPVPLRNSFEFLLPQGVEKISCRSRVKVPFGQRELIGLVVAVKTESEYPLNKLRPIIEVIDDEPLFDESLWQSLLWLSRYYLAPIGEVLSTALPVMIRQGKSVEPVSERVWRLTEHGRSSSTDEFGRAPLQLAIIKRFMKQSLLRSQDFKSESASWYSSVKKLVEKGWLEELEQKPKLPTRTVSDREIELTPEQQEASLRLTEMVEADEFACALLHGVTGSGKTEVYFEAMEKVIEQGGSVLLLVPEIGLTPQLLKRIESQFTQPMVVMHSALNDTERHLAWWHAKNGDAKIVIGTRSAIFSQIPNLKLIVVDEEHDGSFKQQDNVRYQARDFAVYRAKQMQIPIVLGSATPSLESYANAVSGRYQHIRLTKRVKDVALPNIELLDLNKQAVIDGLCPAMVEAIEHTLQQQKQVMLFLNRRGYAPVYYCSQCKQAAKCHRCDSNLTVHKKVNRLRCHHCGYEGRLQHQCGHCKTKDSMLEVGDGTQRVETAIAARFPNASILRIDRDSTQRKGELENLLEVASRGDADILLGTQLITKGHDFPNVGMVGVLEADQGLYSTDFRATETLFQQILQVAGRAGRREDLGRVYIQTRFPEHPLFEFVKSHDFDGFATQLLNERRYAGYPPFGHFALLRAESSHQAKALQFLRKAKNDCVKSDEVFIMDAVPAPMERRAGRFRAQLLFVSRQRSALNAMLSTWLNHIANDKEAKRSASTVRWSLDVDPLDHY